MSCETSFVLPEPREDAEVINHFIDSRPKRIFKQHPDLKEKVKGKGREERLGEVREYLKKKWENNKDEVERKRDLFEENWRKKEQKFMNNLSEVLETDWPKDREITVKVNLNPVSPRFLDTWTTTLFYKRPQSSANAVLAHEITHFLYFKKWKEVYPDTERREMESPSLIWHLSELLVSPISTDERLNSIFQENIPYYDEFDEIQIEGKTAPKYFNDLYQRDKENGKSFAEFLEHAYSKAKEHEEDLKFHEA